MNYFLDAVRNVNSISRESRISAIEEVLNSAQEVNKIYKSSTVIQEENLEHTYFNIKTTGELTQETILKLNNNMCCVI
ncbi:MAG: hypothetical protein Q7S33_04900 [Nanoarchaeota archaeon]|nr:hypothetical protein [Nanoarchaeota archaeon]